MLKDKRLPTHRLFEAMEIAGIRKRSGRGMKVTGAAQLAKFIIQTATLILLGRLLLPTDFGLIAMVAVVTNFVTLFKDAGLAQATVQRDSINHDQISALFWFNCMLSSLLAFAVAASGPLLVWIYSEPKLLGLTIAMAVPMILSGFSLQHRALLQRNMRFGDIARADILGILIGSAVGVWCALTGFGVWSLVAMQIVQIAATSSIVWALAAWKPGLRLRGTGIRSMLGYGVHLSGFSILNYFARNSDKFLIGKFTGAAALGQYSLAYRLILLPIKQINGPIASVLLPALSRLQNDPAEYESLFLRYSRIIAWITIIPIASATLWGEYVIVLLMGDEWRSAGRLFEILAIAAMLQPVSNLSGLLFTSSGKTKELLKWGVFSSFVTVAGFAVALPFGAIGIATSYAITSVSLAVIGWGYAAHISHVKFRNIVGSVLAPAAVGILTIATYWNL